MTNFETADMMIAEEGFFSDPEVCVASLLGKLRAGLIAKNSTIEDCDALMQKIGAESVKFNAIMTVLANAASEFEAQNISEEQLREIVDPCCIELKQNCTALGFVSGDVNFTDDTCDICTQELAVIREFILGAKEAVAEYREELMDAPGAANPSDTDLDENEMEGEGEDDDDDDATEGLIGSLVGGTAATEGVIANTRTATNLRSGTKAQSALSLFKQAKKLKSLGAVDKAVTAMTRAQKLYESLSADADKLFRTHNVERKVKSTSFTLGAAASVSDKYKTTVGGMNYAVIKKYFDDRSDACKSYLLKWKNGAEKGTVAELKNKLKAERDGIKGTNTAKADAEKAAAKAAKEAKKAAKKAATESADFDIDLDLGAEPAGEEDLDDAAIEAMALEAEFAVFRLEDGLDDDEV